MGRKTPVHVRLVEVGHVEPYEELEARIEFQSLSPELAETTE